MVDKVKRAMHEFKHGELHSGSKTGPLVRSRQQAIAIGMSEQKKEDRGGYAEGGIVVGGMRRGQFAPHPAADEERKTPKGIDGSLPPKRDTERPPSPQPGGIRARDGGLIQHRENSGQYANGGMVVHNKSGGAPSESTKARFARNCKGR